MPRPAVSVLMNCLNGARYLQEALDSVEAQTFTDWELVFWDDASTDDSQKIALCSRLSRLKPPLLRYFRGKGNQPLGASRNLALEECRGRYVALLDCDDTWQSQKLARQVWRMENDHDANFTFSDCYLIGPDGRRYGTYFERYAMPYTSRSCYRSLLTQSNFMPSPTLMWNSALLRKVGGFSPQLRYAEVYEACVRMAQQFSGVGYKGEPLASYRIHAGQRGGKGRLGMTSEVLDVLSQHRGQAGWRQYLREGLLWARYGWQLAHR